MNVRIVPLAASIALLAGCASQPAADASSTAMPDNGVDMASVALAPASGSQVSGKLMLMPMGDGVHITGDIGGLAPNSTHGFHIHEKGDCSATDASSAGGHFNPTMQAHGRYTAPQHHVGDNDNLVADANGVAHVNAHFPGAALGGLLIGIVEEYVVALDPWAFETLGIHVGRYKDAVVFGILVGILVFRPSGLLGKYQPEKV